MDEMPCGPAIRYRKVSLDAEDADPRFVRSISFNMESRLALQYLSDRDNKLQTYIHDFNQGHEVFIGPYRVDAISDYYFKVLEIYSCYYHGHSCDPKFQEGELQQERKCRHELRISFLKALLA